MKTKSVFGADFEVLAVRDDFVLLEDMNIGNKSVTNDAEQVVEMILEEHGNSKRIFYVDTEGRIDELCHDGRKFLNFHPGIPDAFLDELGYSDE